MVSWTSTCKTFITALGPEWVIPTTSRALVEDARSCPEARTASPERVRGGQKRFCGLTSSRNGEEALLIPTRRSGMTRISRSGRPVGPLQVNPSAWALVGKGPGTGSPNRRWGGCVAWAPLPPKGSFLGSECSLDTEEEGAEFLHYRAYRFPEQPRLWDRCVQQEHLLLLTYLSEVQRQMALRGHRTRHRAPYGTCCVFSGSESQLSGSAQLFDSLWSQASPLVHFLKDVRLVGLKDGHRVEGHACLTGRDVGLPDKGGSGPTWLSRKEGAGLPRRRLKGGRPKCPPPQAWRCNPAPHNHKVGEVSGRRDSQAGGKNGCFWDLAIS